MDNESATLPLVLVVDDDESILELACEWLTELGYRTRKATSGPEALACMDRLDFDLLFTDIGLPGGIDGFELAIAATNRAPALRTVFASGHAWGPSQNDEPGTTFLHKPYRRDDLEASLRTVLAH